MCVICYKDSTKRELPPEEVFEMMWDTNPDGAGIMWRENNDVKFVKGFMEFKDFMKFVNKNRRKLEETECAFHFRITTHGGTNKENCHPFVIHGTGKNIQPGRQKGKGQEVLMHNGILPITPRRDTISDTAEFALRLRAMGGSARNLVSELGPIDGNRLLVFSTDGVAMTGDWKAYLGYHVSNLNFTYQDVWKPVSKTSRNYLYDYDGFDIRVQWFDPCVGWQDEILGDILFEDVELNRLIDEDSRKEYFAERAKGEDAYESYESYEYSMGNYGGDCKVGM